MTDPSYRETPEAPTLPDNHPCEAAAFVGNVLHVPAQVVQAALNVGGYEARAVRPLPDWMPTPEELDELATALSQWYPFSEDDSAQRLVRAVRWFLEERENR